MSTLPTLLMGYSTLYLELNPALGREILTYTCHHHGRTDRQTITPGPEHAKYTLWVVKRQFI